MKNYYFVNGLCAEFTKGTDKVGLQNAYLKMISENILRRLDSKKPVILCGDLNVAHKEIDIRYPKANERNAGYTIEERTKFQALLDSGFTDTFRYLYPDTIKYTWWSYMFQCQKKQTSVGGLIIF
jgi:exodeoxyribonuclease III